MLSALATVAAAFLGGGLVSGIVSWRKDSRDARRDQVDYGAAWREEARAAVVEVAELRAEVNALRRENEDQRTHSRAQDLAIKQLQDRDAAREATEHHLLQWVALLHTGIENGEIPPMPEVPGPIASILARLHLRPPDEQETS